MKTPGFINWRGSSVIKVLLGMRKCLGSILHPCTLFFLRHFKNLEIFKMGDMHNKADAMVEVL